MGEVNPHHQDVVLVTGNCVVRPWGNETIQLKERLGVVSNKTRLYEYPKPKEYYQVSFYNADSEGTITERCLAKHVKVIDEDDMDWSLKHAYFWTFLRKTPLDQLKQEYRELRGVLPRKGSE